MKSDKNDARKKYMIIRAAAMTQVVILLSLTKKEAKHAKEKKTAIVNFAHLSITMNGCVFLSAMHVPIAGQ